MMRPVNSSGICKHCKHHWSALAGGIDEHGRCPKCRNENAMGNTKLDCDKCALWDRLFDAYANLVRASNCSPDMGLWEYLAAYQVPEDERLYATLDEITSFFKEEASRMEREEV